MFWLNSATHAVPSACSRRPPLRQRSAAVEHPDVVEPAEAALEDVAPGGVLAVDPPGEVQGELLEGVPEELDVALAPAQLLDVVDEERGPGVHRRVHVAEVPLVGGDLAVRVQVALAQNQVELALGEVEIDEGERVEVERQVPGGVPGVLPLVGHGEHVGVHHVEPLVVARGVARRERQGVGAPLLQPLVHVVVVVLLAPQHAGEGLAGDPGRVLAERLRDHGRVEGVRLRLPGREGFVERAVEGVVACRTVG
jgi:hypothetical protein